MHNINKNLLDNSFSTGLFPTVQEGKVQKTTFLPGTFNIIGGTTGSGITSALCSLTAEALNQGKTVAYLANNDPIDRILAKIQLSLLAQKYFYEQNDTDPLRSEDPFRKYIELIVKQENPRDTIQTKALQGGYNPFCEFYNSRKLFFKYFQTTGDNPGEDWEYFADLVRGLPEGSIIMVDYLQGLNIYPGEKEDPSKWAYINQQRRLVYGIHNLAIETGNIFICDALFKNCDCKKKLKLSDFTGPKNIESTADIAIGINKYWDTTSSNSVSYYQVLKNNVAAPSSSIWLDKTGYPYGFIHAKMDKNGMLCDDFEKQWNNQSLEDWAANLEIDNDPHDLDL